jgi:hypothetical protein
MGKIHREEYPVRKWTPATVRLWNNGGGTIDTLMRPAKTPPAKADSEDMRQSQGHTIQYAGDMLAGRLF